MVISVGIYFYTKTDISKNKYVADENAKIHLKLLFEERFVKLECLGNNQEFKYLGEFNVEPKQANLTFKAKINIENKERYIVGNFKVMARVHTIFLLDIKRIGFQLFLKEWHFVSEGEDVQPYCQGDNSSSLLRSNEKPYHFQEDLHNCNKYTLRVDKEKEIYKKLCDVGEQVACEFVDKLDIAKSHYNHKYIKAEDLDEYEKRYPRSRIVCAQKYYKRLCDYNVSFACENLKKILPLNFDK